MQLLTATVKIFLKNPTETQALVQKVRLSFTALKHCTKALRALQPSQRFNHASILVD